MQALSRPSLSTLTWALSLPQSACRVEPADLMADPTLPQWEEVDLTPERLQEVLACAAECERLGLAQPLGTIVEPGHGSRVWALPGEHSTLTVVERHCKTTLAVHLWTSGGAMAAYFQRVKGAK